MKTDKCVFCGKPTIDLSCKECQEELKENLRKSYKNNNSKMKNNSFKKTDELFDSVSEDIRKKLTAEARESRLSMDKLLLLLLNTHYIHNKEIFKK